VSVSCEFEPCVSLGLNLVKYNLPGGPISGVHYTASAKYLLGRLVRQRLRGLR
jgi:hypothetical protein